MKNNEKLKRFIFSIAIVSILLSVCSISINIYQYSVINKNTNLKISSIINRIEEKYPELSETEILEILNSEESHEEILKKYSIDISNHSIVSSNDSIITRSIVINGVFFGCSLIALITMFLFFNKKKDQEIHEITKCIERINHKNYQLDIDDMDEDELSILKTEIYKTTILLKEAAENAVNEKLELKDSLSDISHQLKTPLTSILIILDNLIEDPNMDKEVREDFIKDIKREITNVSFLVQALLKLSKLDTDTINFNQSEVEVGTIIEKVKRNLMALSDLKNIGIVVNLHDNALILCDYKWQVEAITNIVKNCIEYANENTNVEIEVTENKVYTDIVIRDYGKCIDADDLPHIFERFYKGKNASLESVGIGLALAKTIIEKDNGAVFVESSNNKTEFDIKYYKSIVNF